MSCSSSLIDVSTPLVLDTSVLINLHACRHGLRIVSAVPNRMVVTEVVAGELEHETSRRNGEHSFLGDLISSRHVELVEMDEVELAEFGELTSGSLSLDDGEAATIAVAVSREFLPVIDERKGRARAAALVPMCVPGWSLDLLRHPNVVNDLGEPAAVEALFHALRDARMRVPAERADVIIDLIGVDRARLCTCLPKYRERFAQLPPSGAYGPKWLT